MGHAEGATECVREVGETVRRVGGPCRAHPGDHGDRGGRGPGETREARGVRGAQQLRLEHGTGPVRAGLQDCGRSGEHRTGGGTFLGSGGLGLLLPRLPCRVRGLVRGRARWCVVRDRRGRGGGRAVQTVRRQQAPAADGVHAGHRPAGGVQFEVGVVVDGDPHGVAVAHHRTGRELGDPGVQPLAEPGRQRPDQLGGDGRGDRRQPRAGSVHRRVRAGSVRRRVRAGSVRRQVRAHAIFSPTQRASSSGLRAATGMPAATS